MALALLRVRPESLLSGRAWPWARSSIHGRCRRAVCSRVSSGRSIKFLATLQSEREREMSAALGSALSGAARRAQPNSVKNLKP